MKSVSFKTNINCGSCINTITPVLNELDNVDTWMVDTENPNKILKIELEDDNEEVVINAVKNAGFDIEKV